MPLRVRSIPETGNTLESNARLKARYVYDRTGLNVFADDTGLEVDALNGQPGVITARYAGPECDSEKNMRKLLAELANEENRRAQFRTVICLKLGEDEYLFEGVVKGTITSKRPLSRSSRDCKRASIRTPASSRSGLARLPIT